MPTITDKARNLVRDGKMSWFDVQSLLREAKKEGVTDAERSELKSILGEYATQFTKAGRKSLEKFLGAGPNTPTNPTDITTPTTPSTPTTPTTPTQPLSPLREVSELLPNDLYSVSDIASVHSRFLSDLARVRNDLVDRSDLSADQKAQRLFDFFKPYGERVRQFSAYGGDNDAAIKKFGDDLKALSFNSIVMGDSDKDGHAFAVEFMRGDNPEGFTSRADHAPWTTTYWPMAGSSSSPDGNPGSHLWATNGALDKLDKLLAARNLKAGALAFERQPSLNWMLGRSDVMKGKTRPADAQKAGHYIPDSTLREDNAEVTTGVDFDGDGKITAGVKWDFLDSHGNFGTDGKTDSTMSVGWWGSCDKVALAGTLFKEPKKDVTLNGVTFTAQDIKGLLTVLADSQARGTDFVGNRYDEQYDQIRLTNGQTLTGRISTSIELYQPGMRRSGDQVTIDNKGLPEEVRIRTLAGEEKTLKRAEIASLTREDPKDDAALFHTTIREWLNGGMPAVMDKDSGSHVWNYNFWKAEDLETTEKPAWAPEKLIGFNGPADPANKVVYVDRRVALGSGNSGEHYQYWLEMKGDKIVNSGWCSGNPDFLWRPGGFMNFTGTNSRNPFVDPKLVKEIYELSIQ